MLAVVGNSIPMFNRNCLEATSVPFRFPFSGASRDVNCADRKAERKSSIVLRDFKQFGAAVILAKFAKIA